MYFIKLHLALYNYRGCIVNDILAYLSLNRKRFSLLLQQHFFKLAKRSAIKRKSVKRNQRHVFSNHIKRSADSFKMYSSAWSTWG